jgi:hypothetical protein
MRTWSIFWAVVLILVGGLLLLDNLGILAFDLWMIIGPGFLVALGLMILLARPVGKHESEGEDLSIPLEKALRGEIRIRHGAGKLAIGSGAAAGELLSGSFLGGVASSVVASGDGIRASLRGAYDFMPFVGRPFSWRQGLNWDIALNDRIPLALKITTGASENAFDLRGLKVSELDLRCGASEVTIWLPDAAGHSMVSIRGGMGSVRVHVPQEVAARIHVTGGVSEVSIDASRFPRRNGVHESPDFDTARNRVELRVRTGMSSVEVL